MMSNRPTEHVCRKCLRVSTNGLDDDNRCVACSVLVEVKVVLGVEGHSLYIASRYIGGPKSRGGSVVYRWDVPLVDLRQALGWKERP
jgi:hypothetical protein